MKEKILKKGGDRKKKKLKQKVYWLTLKILVVWQGKNF